MSTPPRQESICDLILLTWNRRDLLEPCVERILRYTALPSRLIIVDNGSTDPNTLNYLDQVKGNRWIDITVVRQSRNGTIAAAFNAGLARTTAPWICLLNNDILVTEGWLSEMIDVVSAHPQIGLINPQSNQFGVTVRKGETIDELARRLRRYRGQWLEAAGCVGFCMLLPRQIFHQAGGIDEGFGMYFEDADYSMHVQRLGYVCALAEGAYVHHMGSATIQSDPARVRQFDESSKRFYRKWQLKEPRHSIAYLVGTQIPVSSEALGREIRTLSSRYHHVWVFAPPQARHALIRHVNVVSVVVLGPWHMVVALWYVLFKKRRFDRVVMTERGWAHLFQRVAAWRGTAVEEVRIQSSGRTLRERLSVLLLTKNEAGKLSGCLESVRWADEIVVVDGQSSDRTREIAGTFGAKVVVRPFSGSFSEERNAGLTAATGDWVLQMDADEQVSPELQASITQLLANGSPHATFKVRRRNYFLGRQMHYGGWYHYNTVLFRRNRCRYEGLVHERLKVDGSVGVLPGDLLHRPFDSIAQFLERQNRYTTLQAQELLQDAPVYSKRQMTRQLYARPLKLFWKFYVKKQGFREGMHGFIFSILFAWVDFLKWAKYWELRVKMEEAMLGRQGTHTNLVPRDLGDIVKR